MRINNIILTAILFLNSFLGFSQMVCPDYPTVGTNLPFISNFPETTNTFQPNTLQAFTVRFVNRNANQNDPVDIHHYEWSLDGQVFVGEENPVLAISIPALSTGSYWLEAVPLNSCGERNPDESPIRRLINISGPCGANTTLVQNDAGLICADGSTYAFSMENTSDTYTWTVNNGATITPGDTEATVTFPTGGDYQIRATGVINDLCVYVLDVTAFDNPMDIEGVDGLLTGCIDNAFNRVTYEVVGADNATDFSWNIPTTGLSYDPNPGRELTVTFEEVGSYPISVTPINDCGTGTPYNFTITGEQALTKNNDLLFTNAELAGNAMQELVMNTCEERNSQCQAVLTALDLTVGLDLGEDYDWGEEPFAVEAGFTLTGMSAGEGVLFTEVGTLNITQDRPEAIFKISPNTNLAELRKVKVQIDNYTLNGPVQEVVRLWARYDDHMQIDIDQVTMAQFVASTATSDGWDVRFHWASFCPLVEQYQLRLLKVFENEERPAATSSRWKDALVIDFQTEAGYLPSVTLTMAEGTGKYVWQARPIGNLPGGINNPDNLPSWSLGVQTFNFIQPDEDKNFIYSRTFTEGNRVSEQLTFADGLQRVNQQQTRLQSSQQVVATQTLQDYSGRDVIQTLPVPIKDKSELGYQEQLIVNNTGLYNPEDFDTETKLFSPSPAYLDKGTGNDGYYGGTDNGINEFVPDAQGVPYTRSVYVNDGTGRMKEQSGIGGAHKMGSDHTTRYYYKDVGQPELDFMFGDQAPEHKNTYKEITVDANNTASVSYQSKDGNTIATALAIGGSSENLDGLDSREGATKTITESIVEKTPLGDNASSSSKSWLFTSLTTVNVEYTLSPSTVEDLCANICKTCDYVVTFIVHDLDNPTLTRTLDTHTINAGAINCTDPIVPYNVSFEETFEPGNYTIEKRVRTRNQAPSGNLYLDDHLAEIGTHYQAELDALFNPIDDFIRTENIDLEGLYMYLESQGYTKVEPADEEAYYEIPVGCDGETIQLPIIEQECDEPIDCSDLTSQDFVQYFIDYWTEELQINPLEEGEDSPIDPIFTGGGVFTSYDWLGLPNFPGDGNELYSTDLFQTLMTNFLQEQDADGNYLYDCQLVWEVWQNQVKNYRFFRNMEVDTEDEDAPPYAYNFLQNFFLSVENKLREVEPDEERQLIRKEGFYTTENPTDQQRATIYKLFYYDETNQHMSNCMEGVIGKYNEDNPGDLCDTGSVEGDFLCLNYQERQKIYQCVQYGNYEEDNPEELLEENIQKIVDQCLSTCEDNRLAFRQSIINDIHNKDAYIEGDAYELELDPVRGVKRPTGEPRDPAVFDISLCELEEMENDLVDNCLGYCQIDMQRDADGKVIGPPSEEQQTNVQKVLLADFEVNVNLDGATSCEDDTWDYIPAGSTESSNHTVLAGFDHDGFNHQNTDVQYDDQGNIYMISRVTESGIALNDPANTVIVPDADQEGLVIVKYNNLGQYIWHKEFYIDVIFDTNPIESVNYNLPASQELGVGFSFKSSFFAFDLENIKISDDQGNTLLILPSFQNSFVGAISADGMLSWMNTGTNEKLFLPTSDNGTSYYETSNYSSPSIVARNFDGSEMWTTSQITVSAAGGYQRSNYEMALDGNDNLYMVAYLEVNTSGNDLVIRGVNTGFEGLRYVQKVDPSGNFDTPIFSESDPVITGVNENYDVFGYEHGYIITTNGRIGFSTETSVTLNASIYNPSGQLLNSLNNNGQRDSPYFTSMRYSALTNNNFYGAVSNRVVDYHGSFFFDEDAGTWALLNGPFSDDQRLLDFYFPVDNTEEIFLPENTDYVRLIEGNVDARILGPIEFISPYSSRLFTNKGTTSSGDCSHPSLCFRFGDPLTEIIIPDGFEPYVYTAEPLTCEELTASSIIRALDFQQQEYIDGKLQAFTDSYNTNCADATIVNDNLTLTYDLGLHHYTLYYYDRAGNLMRTVPPLGFNASDPNDHQMQTRYHHNSLGQLVKQSSPDGGETFFYYNDIGQLRFSQNAKQLADGNYSYTKYDPLGRIVEVGESSEELSTFTRKFREVDFPSVGEEKTVTYYTTPYAGTVTTPQRYLQNRVSYTYLDNDGLDATLDDRTYTIYSYDPHGNVDWLEQTIPGLGSKRIEYKYDLISGNVLQVSYNPEQPDQFYHKYDYDEDNRLIKVYTSTNAVQWDQDAEYEYYPHGPMKSATLGEDKVQQLDYVYTIHGWLKAINNPETKDETGNIGSDAFAMALNYYSGDYVRSGTAADGLTPATSRDLYNGNISAWEIANHASDDSWMRTGFQYQYDELNRIKDSRFNVQRDGTFYDRGGFNANFTLDANGNLLTLNRNDVDATNFDALTYTLQSGKNRLAHVKDAISDATLHAKDIESQEDNNYNYDPIGNLIRDEQEKMDIDWTVYGKVDGLTKEDGSGTNFLYDAAGNRVRKETTDKFGNVHSTFYIRDASGNIMSTYRREDLSGISGIPKLSEVPIYGSDRLGNYTPQGAENNNQNAAAVVSTDLEVDGYQGVSYKVDQGTQLTLNPGFSFEEGEDGTQLFVSGPNTTSDDIDPLSIVYTRRLDFKQYELKDHLGNVRDVIKDRKLSTLSGGVPTNFKPVIVSAAAYYPYGMDMPTVKWETETVTATMEPYNILEEYGAFDNYTSVETEDNIFFNHTPETDASFSFKLTAADGSIIGLAKSLKVQAGDKVSAEVFGKYIAPTGSNPTNVAATFTSAFLEAFGLPGTQEAGAIGEFLGDVFATGSVLNKDNNTNTEVTAGINWIRFDDNFEARDGGFSLLTTAAGSGRGDHEQLSIDELVVPEDGYIFIYTSNESDQVAEVYFDDFSVSHEKLVTDERYNPDLLAYRYGFNGMEKDQNGEFSSGTTYTTHFRQYDPRIGRWLSFEPKPVAWESPYAAFRNNPVIYNDPMGDCPDGKCKEVVTPAGNEVTIESDAHTYGADGKVDFIITNGDNGRSYYWNNSAEDYLDSDGNPYINPHAEWTDAVDDWASSAGNFLGGLGWGDYPSYSKIADGLKNGASMAGELMKFNAAVQTNTNLAMSGVEGEVSLPETPMVSGAINGVSNYVSGIPQWGEYQWTTAGLDGVVFVGSLFIGDKGLSRMGSTLPRISIIRSSTYAGLKFGRFELTRMHTVMQGFSARFTTRSGRIFGVDYHNFAIGTKLELHFHYFQKGVFSIGRHLRPGVIGELGTKNMMNLILRPLEYKGVRRSSIWQTLDKNSY